MVAWVHHKYIALPEIFCCHGYQDRLAVKHVFWGKAKDNTRRRQSQLFPEVQLIFFQR